MPGFVLVVPGHGDVGVVPRRHDSDVLLLGEGCGQGRQAIDIVGYDTPVVPVVVVGVAEFVDSPVVIVVVNAVPCRFAENNGSQSRVGVDGGRYAITSNDPVSFALEKAGAHIALEEAIGDISPFFHVEYRGSDTSVNLMFG